MAVLFPRLGLTLLLLLAAPARAQQRPFRTYTAQDGLIRSAVRTLCQDTDGFLWLGTSHGLSRYDGVTFRNYTTGQGLPDNLINDLLEDRHGDLWIATNHGGLSRYREGTFTTVRVDPHAPEHRANRVNTIYETRAGPLLIGTDGGAFVWDGARFVPVPSEVELHDHAVFAILETRDGALWLGTDRGLLARPAGAPAFRLFSRTGEAEVTALAEDRTGTLWIGTTRGLRRLAPRPAVPAADRSEPLPALLRRLATREVRALLVDADGGLWIATGAHGVSKWTAGGELTTFTVANGLAGNHVRDVLRDREGNLWFATVVGASKLSVESIVNYGVPDGLPDHAVYAVARDRAGRYWFGTRQGLGRLSGDTIVVYTQADGLASDYVLQLLEDAGGGLWVGTTHGASRFVEARDAFVAYGARDGWRDRAVTGNRARALYRDEQGTLWFGNDDGVSLFQDGRFVQLPLRPAPPAPLVAGLLRDDGGDLWVGFHEGGIVRYAVTPAGAAPALVEVARYGKRDGLGDDHVRSSLKDGQGHLWFGTRFGGAVRFVMADGRVKAVERYTEADGLAGNSIRCMLQDRAGKVWFATDGGVSYMVREPRDRRRLRQLTMADGLAGEDATACYEDRQGHLWFGTSNGVTRYDPAFRRPDPVAPPVYITQVQIPGVADSSLALMQHVRLGYRARTVAFEYVGVSLRNEAGVRYQYMLEGYDDGWSPLTSRRYVNYNNLAPGAYVFRVRARSADGVWSTSPATLALYVAAPFWNTWWFLTLALLAAAALVVGVHRVRMQKELELERLRRKIATDLHDDIGSTLSSISIFSELARRETEGVAPGAARLLQRIGENARAMLEAMDDIVWTINPENDALEHVTLRMREFAAALFESYGIAFTLALPADPTDTSLPMEVRRHFYLIFKEAVNNAVRHACCRNAAVTLKLQGGRLVLTVADDGVGFDPAREHPGDGLKNMQRRAAAIGGTLTVDARPHAGTTIRLDVPIA